MLQPKVALRAAVLLLAAQAHAFTFTPNLGMAGWPKFLWLLLI